MVQNSNKVCALELTREGFLRKNIVAVFQKKY